MPDSNRHDCRLEPGAEKSRPARVAGWLDEPKGKDAGLKDPALHLNLGSSSDRRLLPNCQRANNLVEREDDHSRLDHARRGRIAGLAERTDSLREAGKKIGRREFPPPDSICGGLRNYFGCQSSTKPPTSGSRMITARPSFTFMMPPSVTVMAPSAFAAA